LKRPTKILILASLMVLLSTSFIFIQPTLAWVAQSGFESEDSGSMESKVKIQAHAVYNDNDQGGVTDFGVFINGKYSTLCFSAILIQIYALAEYDVEEINWKTGQYSHYTYWGAAPSDLLSWGGDFSYNSQVPGEWTWNAGVTAYGMTLGASYRSNPVSSYGSENRLSGGYRYLGWFQSKHNSLSGHEFSALLRLHVINDRAIDWANGIHEENFPVERMTKVLNIRVQFVFLYYSYWFPYWYMLGHHIHTMGDGAPLTDLNYIPLIVGSTS